MISRRTVLVAAALTASGISGGFAAQPAVVRKKIPSSGEELPAVGLGTSEVFEVNPSSADLQPLIAVTQALFAGGGRVVDTSPMYGTAEAVLGRVFAKAPPPREIFVATKVWTDGREAGMQQMQASMQRIGVGKLDLVQIHNLRDWKTHLVTLREWKQSGKIRYLGITGWHQGQHADLARVIRAEQFDFLQVNYSVGEREAEKELLPLARDRGTAVIANRPFGRGRLLANVAKKPLPTFAQEIDCSSWAQLLLKFVISHPAITCAIPATSNANHMSDNMGAAYGRMPDESLRSAIADAVGSA